MDHVYIKLRTPRLNGKVEHSHHTDKQAFYQLNQRSSKFNRNFPLSLNAILAVLTK